MKKIVCWILVILISQSSLAFAGEGENTDVGNEIWYNTKFVVTAYYTPLPNQEIYYKGSYEAETRMNGDTIAANGKEVFTGLIATPKTYSFGTKIDLKGIGIGTVGDRGGAIVKAGERDNPYDRIDIWVGYGEEGLKRALTFGKKVIEGKILKEGETGQSGKLELTNFKIAPVDFSVYKKENDVFNVNINEKSGSEIIKKLQNILKEIGFYNDNVNGIFDTKLEEAIFAFQVEAKILQKKEDVGSYYYGPKTRETLKKYYKDFQDGKIKKIETTKKEEVKKIEKTAEVKSDIKKEVIKEVKNTTKEKVNQTKKDVKKETDKNIKNKVQKEIDSLDT
ncbi:MAG: peptidoglycan-binding protein, partial [Candidatus Gracilibacteria bacterium]|nr:peptidoglycan-binding protein [Candidatus Gracilibacteria bacterium]